MDTEKEIERLQDRNLDIQREVSTQLWSSLIVVNGLMLTVLVGISAFQSYFAMANKIILALMISLLVLSSVALVWNLVTTKSVYRRIGDVLNSPDTLDEDRKTKDINSALADNKRLLKIEKLALITIVLSAGLLLAFVLTSLFF